MFHQQRLAVRCKPTQDLSQGQRDNQFVERMAIPLKGYVLNVYAWSSMKQSGSTKKKKGDRLLFWEKRKVPEASSRRVAGNWFIWFLRFDWCVWFDERERQNSPAHRINARRRRSLLVRTIQHSPFNIEHSVLITPSPHTAIDLADLEK